MYLTFSFDDVNKYTEHKPMNKNPFSLTKSIELMRNKIVNFSFNEALCIPNLFFSMTSRYRQAKNSCNAKGISLILNSA